MEQLENVMKDIEEINVNQRLHSMTYRKTGLYILYPFLLFVIVIVVALFKLQRDIVIELTGMISNPDAGFVVTPLSSGQIDNVLVSNHQNVNLGDILLTLDTSNIKREIYLVETDIAELNLQLTYINYFEESIIAGNNLMPSDNFGYRLRIEQHFRSLVNDGIELNHLASNRNISVATLTRQIEDLEIMLSDYQNFILIVNEEDYGWIYGWLVYVRVQEFRANLATFDDDDESPSNPTLSQSQRQQRDQQRDIFIANTRVDIEQNVFRIENDLRRLNDELQTVNRNFGHEQETLGTRELNASERLIIEIFDSRERLQNQIQTLERQLENLQEDYQNHTITANASGRFQMIEQFATGASVNFGAELGRIFDIDDENNYIQGHFPSADFNRVHLDQNVTLVLIDGDNNRHLIFGTIELISQVPISTDYGNFFTFQARIDTNNLDLALQSGMAGELNIITGRNTWWNYLINRFF